MGLSEIDEFVSHSIYNKKIVILIGNCHMGVIKEMLRSNCKFDEEFGIYDLPAICDIKQHNFYEEYEMYLKHANVIIQQDIRDDNKIDVRFSCSYVKSKIQSESRHICIINTYGLGKIYYPYFVHGNLYNVGYSNNEHGYFPFDDLILDNFIKSGFSLEEIVNMTKGNIEGYEPIDIEKIFEKYGKREGACDVKVMNYIKQNYSNRMLFYDIAHPTNDVLWYEVQQIFSILNMDDGRIEKRNIGNLSAFATPIYPFVKERLGLQFDNKWLGDNARIRLSTQYMDLEEYVREYYYWCSGRILSESSNTL